MSDERPIAKFSPSLRAIKLYRDGRIEYGNQRGSVAGATARVDQSGSKRIFRDTRQTYITIEGPEISISAKLTNNGGMVVSVARKFAAKVNKHAMHLRAPAAMRDAGGVIDQLERLAKLRDSGALTAKEFETQKAALMPPSWARERP